MPQSPDRMTRAEFRAAGGLAGVFGLRMLGLFIVLPVFALYARGLPGGSDMTRVGIALGAYGLTQALLQLPFGWLSDRIGRKRAIHAGLLLFAAGSFLAGAATDLALVTAGRILQGAGAISAAVMALAADLTRDEVRTRAMAMIGSTIGAAFGISLIAGPWLGGLIGVPGIFHLTGVLALGAMVVVHAVVPEEPVHDRPARSSREDFAAALRDPELLRLNLGIFVLHAVLMALFIVVPFRLETLGLPGATHWKVYLGVITASVLLMLPAIFAGERGGRGKPVLVCSVALLLVVQILFPWLSAGFSGTVLALVLFFTAFNVLEAMLPSRVSRAAPPQGRGTAIGIYSSFQFVGTFTGATVGGWLSQHAGAHAVHFFCAGLLGLWLVAAAGMQRTVLATRLYRIPSLAPGAEQGLTEQLLSVPGVREALVRGAEGVACLKVEARMFDERSVKQLIAAQT